MSIKLYSYYYPETGKFSQVRAQVQEEFCLASAPEGTLPIEGDYSPDNHRVVNGVIVAFDSRPTEEQELAAVRARAAILRQQRSAK